MTCCQSKRSCDDRLVSKQLVMTILGLIPYSGWTGIHGKTGFGSIFWLDVDGKMSCYSFKSALPGMKLKLPHRTCLGKRLSLNFGFR